ncbi:hypothetical protein [Streptomyces sp. WAC01280]|uniref:hypothetical protein n=1 Tax=Streptomyces sp. WAC01280 TaxID=2487424 RepID=UPI000F78B34C|nr:hypothetical protein [Streptomyces sp. WAC01280]RSS51356.1 hypothetical protein EF909_34245 [Streptomyces sp. WAC01280]
MSKFCGYCEKPIIGEAVDRGGDTDHARPSVYWHPLGHPDCVRAKPLTESVPHIGGIPVNRTSSRRRGPRSS